MDDLRYEWNERKNRANQRKHGVAFEEARTAFLDENARRTLDPDCNPLTIRTTWG